MLGATFDLKDYGLDLAAFGSVVSCLGVVENNLLLNHVAAMQIWMVSNLILFAWAYGLWKQKWDGGLSGMVLCGMYAFYSITNIWGLMHVWTL